MHENFLEDVDKTDLSKITIKGELTIVVSEKSNIEEQFNEQKIIEMARLFLQKYSRDTVNLIMNKAKVNKKRFTKFV